MIFRVFDRAGIRDLFETIAAASRIVGPVRIATDRNGAPLYSFEPVEDFSLLRLDYTTTRLSAKRYSHPYREVISEFHFRGDDWEKTSDLHVREPIVLFGLHACDINALNKLDKVLLQSDYPMPYYAARRRNMFIIGYDCSPNPSCFCRSMGSDTALHGFDMFLTDLGGRFFVEVLSGAAFNLLKEIPTREPSGKDHQAYVQAADAKSRKFAASVDTTDLTKILDMEFQSPVWKDWGDRCFSCGTCASVCPTCYCYGIEESVTIDLKGGKKTKALHSCNLIDFAVVAGGHNFRPGRDSRLKYRYYHKHRGFVEAYEESLCVGCGRCGDSCLAGITVPEVIASVRKGGMRAPEA